MKPFKCTPFLKETVWGGSRLTTGKACGKIGESWEVSDRKEGLSLVDGEPFDRFYAEHRTQILGSAAPEAFPFLIKKIDAADRLSVQVHPCEGENAKTEMWYILDAEPHAELILGFSQDMTKAAVEESLKAGSLEACMHKVSVKKGDSFLIPAGLVHAIGKGIFILEVQQNADTTYRLFDYNRGRPLHIRQALACADFNAYKPVRFPENVLAACAHFTVKRAKLPIVLSDFAVLYALNGAVTVMDLTINEGEIAVLPAVCAPCEICGDGELIYVTR